ncbi:MAG: CapA family protein, partial [Clostridia bacterium]|nr:CapA family protein [Clostridia bacterium]
MKNRIISVLLILGMCTAFASCGLKQNKEPAENTDGTTESVITTAEPAPAEPTEVRISFAAAGDNLIHESVYKTAKTNAAALASTGGPAMDYYFLEMYSEKLRNIISSADLAFVNQEAPIVPDRPAAGYPAFNTPTEAGDTLVEMGFDIVNLANNHMLDMEGQCEGLQSTIDYWNSKDIMPVGAYESKDDYNTLRIMECKGKKIAVLSYTYGTNGNKLNYKSSDLVVPYINDSTIIEQVSRAEDYADAVIVSMHWGDENKFA